MHTAKLPIVLQVFITKHVMYSCSFITEQNRCSCTLNSSQRHINILPPTNPQCIFFYSKTDPNCCSVGQTSYCLSYLTRGFHQPLAQREICFKTELLNEMLILSSGILGRHASACCSPAAQLSYAFLLQHEEQLFTF